MTNQKISVVINTYNASKHLARVLDAVKNYDFIKDPGKIRGLYIPRKNYTMKVFLPSSYPDVLCKLYEKQIGI